MAKKRNKKEIQKELKGMILKQAKELQKDKYFINDINIECDSIETGWTTKDKFVINEDSGLRTMTIRYRDKEVKIKGEQ